MVPSIDIEGMGCNKSKLNLSCDMLKIRFKFSYKPKCDFLLKKIETQQSGDNAAPIHGEITGPFTAARQSRGM